MVFVVGVCGVCAGLIGAGPFFVLARLMRSRPALRDTGLVPLGLLGVFVSCILMVAALLACAHFAFEYLLVFALICIAIFLLATGVFVWQMGRVAGPVAADGETPGASMKGEDRS